MWKRKRKTADPCHGCFLHPARCICARIPRLDLRTRITVVVHTKELKRTTNTGRLAIRALQNAQMLVRGDGREPLDLSEILHPLYKTYLLYPAAGAQDLFSVARDGPPVHLIVPDGNWRQASKVHTRHPELKVLPRLQLAAPVSSGPVMRKEHFAGGMATLQAIAYALGHWEGPEVTEDLLELYYAKLYATLAGRPPPACVYPNL